MKYFFFLVFTACIAHTASAQLTFTSSDFLSQQRGGQTFTSFQDTSYSTSDQQTLMLLITDTGTGRTWTMGGANWLSEGTYTSASYYFPYPDNAPLAEDFPGATHVFVPPFYVNDTPFKFYTIDNTGEYLLGETQDSLGFSSEVTSYSPPQELMAFPLHYGVTWQSNSTEPVNTFPSGSDVMQVTTGTCDGEGTLSVPGHSEQAIKVTVTQTGSASFFGVDLGSYTTTNYYWFTKSGFTVSMQSSSDFPGQISQPTYSIPVSSGVTEMPFSGDRSLMLRLSQNPVSNFGTKLFYTLSKDEPVQVLLMDPLGRKVKMLVNGMGHTGQNEILINPTSLACGNYFLRVMADGKVAMIKLTIAR